MLKNVDVLVFDIQDVGARFYTYPTTLAYVLEASAPLKIPVYVLDRPNPVNGVAVEGPLLDAKYFSFLGYFHGPIRHGLTVGELARLYNGENKIAADLRVIPMQGWRRSMFMDETGLEWVSPSPAIRSLTAAILYPGSCLLENDAVLIERTSMPLTRARPRTETAYSSARSRRRRFPAGRSLDTEWPPSDCESPATTDPFESGLIHKHCSAASLALGSRADPPRSCFRRCYRRASSPTVRPWRIGPWK